MVKMSTACPPCVAPYGAWSSVMAALAVSPVIAATTPAPVIKAIATLTLGLPKRPRDMALGRFVMAFAPLPQRLTWVADWHTLIRCTALVQSPQTGVAWGGSLRELLSARVPPSRL